MADLTARPDSWTDYLPGNLQQSINTSPLLNALRSAVNRPAPDLTRGIEHDQYGSVSDRNWLLQQAAGGPPKMNPLAAEMLDKGGLLANFLGPGVKLPATAPKPTGIRAYHGSPHDFDRFDINKIGTGEGAQAYGPGLYFAESEGVARSYRDGLSRGRIQAGNRSIPVAGTAGPGSIAYQRQYANMSLAERMLADHNGNFDRSIRDLMELASIKRKNPKDAFISETPEAYEAAVEQLKAMRSGEWAPPSQGRMYEVRINADPEQFLDWDKPLAQQPEGVRGALETALKPLGQPTRGKDGRWRFYPDSSGFDTIDQARAVSDVLRNSKIGDNLRGLPDGYETALRDAGIPGIKYLDQMSRTAGEGSRNYVVFDDKLIEILRKYGLLPPVAAGTAAALNQQEPPL